MQLSKLYKVMKELESYNWTEIDIYLDQMTFRFAAEEWHMK